MKKVYRYENNEEYWDRRWQDAGHDAESFQDLTIYPIRYAEMVMTDPKKRAVEIGCGLGRVVKHYHRKGFAITGLERSAVAINRLKSESPDLDTRQGDVMALPYQDGEFDVVLAFGLYHNLETGLDDALAETSRVLAPGGRFAISMRPNNFEMNANESYWRWRWRWRWRTRKQKRGARMFHKLLVGEREFSGILRNHGLETDSIHRARNVSLWYRVPFLRNRAISQASEDVRRSAGYRLNALGRTLDRITTTIFPYHSANVIVFVGHKAES
jgi:SAM-dependent methyltransferase